MLSLTTRLRAFSLVTPSSTALPLALLSCAGCGDDGPCGSGASTASDAIAIDGDATSVHDGRAASVHDGRAASVHDGGPSVDGSRCMDSSNALDAVPIFDSVRLNSPSTPLLHADESRPEGQAYIAFDRDSRPWGVYVEYAASLLSGDGTVVIGSVRRHAT
jgi:hypothetical protein